VAAIGKPERFRAPTEAHQLSARRPAKVAAIALANKMARIVWALLTKGGTFIRKNVVAEHAAA
jgi:hypothetical protein